MTNLIILILLLSLLRNGSSILMTSKQNLQVISVGEALFDCIAPVEFKGMSIDAINDLNKNVWEVFPGGAPANTACMLSKLGIRTGFAGCLGDDHLGNTFIDILKTAEVDTRYISKDKSFPSREVFVTREAITGDRIFTGFANNAKAKDFADYLY